MSGLEQLTHLAKSTLSRFHLDQKMAMVVGGSQGLGQAMALALAAAGADVCGRPGGGKSGENGRSHIFPGPEESVD